MEAYLQDPGGHEILFLSNESNSESSSQKKNGIGNLGFEPLDPAGFNGSSSQPGVTIAQIEAIDYVHSLALIRVAKEFLDPLELSVEKESPLSLWGFFEGNYFRHDTVLSDKSVMGLLSERMTISVNWKEGYLGSPIVSSNGKVVSVVVEPPSSNSSFAMAVSASAVEEFIQRAEKGRNLATVAAIKTNDRSNLQNSIAEKSLQRLSRISFSRAIASQILESEKQPRPILRKEDRKNIKFSQMLFQSPDPAANCKEGTIFSKNKRGFYLQCRRSPGLDFDETTRLGETNFLVLSNGDLSKEFFEFPKLEAFLKDKEGRSLSSKQNSFCHIKNVLSKQKARMMVRVCEKSISDFPGLSTTFVKINFFEEQFSDVLIQFYISGSSFDFAINRTLEFLDSIHLENHED